MEIRIFEYKNKEFIQRHIAYDAFNIRYKIHAFEPSDFSFDCHLSIVNNKEIKRGWFVLIESEMNSGIIGVIENIKKNSDANNNIMSVSGRDIKGMLSRRVVVRSDFTAPSTLGASVVSGWTDSCIRRFWRENIGENAHPKRRIEEITIVDIDKNIGIPNDMYSARFGRLSTITATLAHNANLVINVTPKIDEGTILLEVVKPENRTVSSGRPLILSLDRQTALQLEHIQELSNFRNTFYTSENDNPETNIHLYMRDGEAEPSGLDRHEEHIIAHINDVSELRRQALHRMTEYEEVNVINAQSNFTHLQYKRDYNVGDFVTVQNVEWGVEADIQITAVEISHNGGGRAETITLGTGNKGYIRKLLTHTNNRS